jgi:hypothetical protein
LARITSLALGPLVGATWRCCWVGAGVAQAASASAEHSVQAEATARDRRGGFGNIAGSAADDAGSLGVAPRLKERQGALPR